MKVSFRTNLSLIKNARKTQAAAPEAWAAGQYLGKVYLDRYVDIVTHGTGGLARVPSPPMPNDDEMAQMLIDADEGLKEIGVTLEWNEVERRAFEWGFMSVLMLAEKKR
jgi:hypothetical protein